MAWLQELQWQISMLQQRYPHMTVRGAILKTIGIGGAIAVAAYCATRLLAMPLPGKKKPPPAPAPAPPPPPVQPKASKPATPAPAPAPLPKPKLAAAGSEAEKLRGYKTTKDGKTTTYFHREVSDEAKKLQEEQGLLSPKKISAAQAEAFAAKESSLKQQGTSVWNTLGTSEEKDMMKWAREHLVAVLVGQQPDSNAAKFVAVKDVKGDAFFSLKKQRKARLFDLEFVATWEAAGCAGGKLKLTNFANDGGSSDGDEYEYKFLAPPPPTAVRSQLCAHIEAALKRWVCDFNGL
eukprot:SAG22_NODE_528_length_9431_cov_7.192135_11_plen_293_part_00